MRRCSILTDKKCGRRTLCETYIFSKRRWKSRTLSYL